MNDRSFMYTQVASSPRLVSTGHLAVCLNLSVESAFQSWFRHTPDTTPRRRMQWIPESKCNCPTWHLSAGKDFCIAARRTVCNVPMRPQADFGGSHALRSRQAAKSSPAGRTYRNSRRQTHAVISPGSSALTGTLPVSRSCMRPIFVERAL